MISAMVAAAAENQMVFHTEVSAMSCSNSSRR